MSILTSSNRIDYTADGVQTTYSFAFAVYTQTDLQVYVTPTGGTSVLQVLNTDYTQTAVNVPGGNAGGSVVFSAPPTNTYQVTLIRKLPILQQTSFTNLDKFDAKTAIEGTYDKVVMIEQQLNEVVSRAPVLPVDSLLNPEFPLPGASKFIRWNSSGTSLEAVDITGGALNATMDAFNAVNTAGLPTAGQAGRARYVTDASRGLWIDQGNQFYSLTGEIYNVKSYGAVGNGTTDDTTAIQAAITACPAGGMVYFPPGNYKFSTLTISTPITLQGGGWSTTTVGVLGDANWTQANGKCFGSILRSTATSGNAILCDHATLSQAYNFNDIMLIGPGSGTSTGVMLGTTAAPTAGHWSNVMIANFSVGMDLVAIEDYGFFGVRLRGNGINLQVESNTNQNVFVNMEIQKATTGIKIKGGSLNCWYGGLIQGNTIGVLFDSAGAEELTFDGLWLESNATSHFKFDATAAAWTGITIRNTRSSGGTPVTFAGATTANWNRFIGNQWAAATITLPSNFLNTLWVSNNTGALTDNALNTSYGETLKGTATFAGAATKAVTFGSNLDNSTYIVTLSVNVNETIWVTAKGVGGFTLNSSNAASTAVVEWHVIR